MSEVLKGVVTERASLAAELGALDAGIAAYRRALVPTKTRGVRSPAPERHESGREEELSLLAKHAVLETKEEQK